MGSYPSATLAYGVDLGAEEEWDTPWYTDELEEEYGDVFEAAEALLKDVGATGVRLDTYGNFNSGYTLAALSTRRVRATAYDAELVTLAMLETDADDIAKLERAWAVLRGGPPMPPPSWFIVVSYG